MTGRDRIWWTPDISLVVDKRGRRVDGPIHVCPTAVLCCLAVRESLDPMALGTCRYCGGTLA